MTRGSAAVDFVLVSALLTLMFAGVLQLSLSLHVRNTLVDAAGEGARYGALVGRDSSDAVDRTQQLIASSLSDRLADDVSASVERLDGVQTVVVTVRAPLPVLGLVGPRTLELSGHAVDEKALP
ncbi:TadE family protein [Aquipuribacter hungaricus]|uniref:TadE family protein n=1 Tax=Aquipuribacter hungaricus TaxID=545624 RepID=A0ABV7WHD3_9MICO